jgi:hypothetical protein
MSFGKTNKKASALLPAPSTDPVPLADIEGGETNLLSRSAWSDPSNPLKVRFDPWENSQPSKEDPECVRVYLGSTEVGVKEWDAPISPDDLFVPISADKLSSGEHTLTYIVTIWSGTPQGSEPLTITLDKEAPLLNISSELIFPADVLPPNEVTAAYLADPANGDQLLATLPDYDAIKVGDVITWYWELSPVGREVAGTRTLQPDDLGTVLKLPFSGDILRNLGNGIRTATYRVRDRAGNESTLSSSVPLSVNIRPPTPRKFPTVKEASSTPAGTGVLDPFRGASGLTVVVEASEVDPGDTVTVDFIGSGGEGGIGSITGVQPITPGGLEFAIPASIVAPNIPVSGIGNEIEVKYWVAHDTQHSAVYTLTINALEGGRLGRIECPLAQIGSPAALSKSAVPAGGTNLEINQWAYQAPGQLMRVWAIASGVQTDFLNGVPLDAVGKFTTLLPKAYVEPLALASVFTVYASVSFDQGQSYHVFKEMPMKLIA